MLKAVASNVTSLKAHFPLDEIFEKNSICSYYTDIIHPVNSIMFMYVANTSVCMHQKIVDSGE